jgi:CheY-like chemotaxis protein
MFTKVLVFESDPAFAGELRNELGKLNCATTVVDDGNAGLQQAATDRPDLILLSIELPRMNGFSVCNKLKKDPNLKDVPLIIMSSESSDETFEQHKKLRTRAEDYVHKPIAFGELLHHIQSFIALTGSANGEGESGIVIDDEIEIGGSDYLVEDEELPVSAEAPAGARSSAGPPARGMGSVDADVDAFAESAFGRLTDSEAAATALQAAHGPRNGAAVEPRAPASRPARATQPPPPRGPSTRPPATVDFAEHERLRDNLAKARGRVDELEGAVKDAQSEVERLRATAAEVEQLRAAASEVEQLRAAASELEGLRDAAAEAERLGGEVEELRSKLASSAKATGVSSREFLDLREALNRKDKEILGLKEQLARKDKEIAAQQDRTLALERGSADLDEKMLGLERELAEAKEKSEAFGRDRDLAKKVADDMRARFEKVRAEVDAKERQFAEARVRFADELNNKEARLATLRAELDQILANERAEHARALDHSEQRRRVELGEARREREAALAEARDQSQRELQDALAAQEEQLTEEYNDRLAATRREHETALAALHKDREEKLAQAVAEVEGRERGVREQMEAAHSDEVRALEENSAAEIGAANDKLAKRDMDLSAARGELAALREAKSTEDAAAAARATELEKGLSEALARTDELEKRCASAGERITALETESEAVRQDLEQTRQRLGGETSRADRAVAKWDADRQSLERAKDALAFVLSQIEEAEGRAIG